MQEYEKSAVNALDYYLCQKRNLNAPMLILMNDQVCQLDFSLCI